MEISKIIKTSVYVLTMALLANCSGVKFSAAQNASSDTGVGGTPTVCNPFGSSGGQGQAANGLVANQIRYLGADQINSNNDPIPSINVFNDLWNVADGIFNVNVFLSQINTPNTYFTEGFSANGSAPMTAGVGGATLIQYFGFQLKSTFVLGNLAPGPYQLAVLSDDGSNLTISGGLANGGDFVINNDGTHPLLMGCYNRDTPSAPPILNLTSATTQFPLEFDYFQGPRVTIGLMLLYRPMPPGNPADAQCGQGAQGDGYFFEDNDGNGNPISPSIPTAAYNSLLTEQYPWTVVPAINYVLPSSNPVNPCGG